MLPSNECCLNMFIAPGLSPTLLNIVYSAIIELLRLLIIAMETAFVKRQSRTSHTSKSAVEEVEAEQQHQPYSIRSKHKAVLHTVQMFQF